MAMHTDPMWCEKHKQYLDTCSKCIEESKGMPNYIVMESPTKCPHCKGDLTARFVQRKEGNVYDPLREGYRPIPDNDEIYRGKSGKIAPPQGGTGETPIEKHDCEKWRNEGAGCSVCSKSHLMSIEQIKEVQNFCNWKISEQGKKIEEMKEIIEDLVNQHCSVDDKNLGTILDSMALSTNRDAMDFLINEGRIETLTRYGRRIIGRWKQMPEIKIMKNTDDPICPRISAGGTDSVGFYLVYRGEAKEVLSILRNIADKLEQDIHNGIIHEPSPDEKR